MYLMIDNFDSFVYNLKAYFEEMGRCVTVKRCDRISLHDVEDLEPEGIILSPGPGRPWEAKMCVDVVNMYKGKLPSWSAWRRSSAGSDRPALRRRSPPSGRALGDSGP